MAKKQQSNKIYVLTCMIPLKIVYFANVLVAGWISITCLFFPKTGQLSIFEGTFVYSEAIRLVGALWGALDHGNTEAIRHTDNRIDELGIWNRVLTLQEQNG